MKVAYVSHHKRPNYEYRWFAAMPADKVVFITTEKPTGKVPRHIEHRVVEYDEGGWENKFFASTALRVLYQDFEKAVADVDVVVVLEVFSSLSKQFVKYCNSINKPVVVLVYELIDTHPIYKLPRYRGNTKYCLKHADHFVAVSHAASQHLVKLGADPSKITVVYPGVDRTKFKANRQGRSTSLIFVGKMEVHKGIDLVIDLYERLVKDKPNLPLTLVGEGSWTPRVKELAAAYPGVVYHGQIPNDEVPAALNKHALYLLPVRDTLRFGQRIGAEQFGFSIVEAMSCGLAIVTTECGALPEIVTDRNIVCPQGDSEALYRATKALLDDPKALKILSTYNEKLAAERYDLTTEAKRFLDVLEQVAKRKVDR